MEIPKLEPGHWNHTAVVAKKPSILKKNKCSHADISKKITGTSLGHKSKSPKCYIKIAGSRYNGAFLVSIDPAIDDAIYKTMRDTEVRLNHQLKSELPSTRESTSPKNCLYSVFKCYTQSSNLQDFKKKYSVEQPRKKFENCVTKNKTKTTESRPVVRTKPPKQRREANKDLVETFKSSLGELNQPEKSDVEVIFPLQVRALDNIFTPTKPSQTPKSDVSNDPLKEKVQTRVSKIEMLKKKPLKSEEKTSEIELEVNPHLTVEKTPKGQMNDLSDQLKDAYKRVSEDEILKTSLPNVLNCTDEVQLNVKHDATTAEECQPNKLVPKSGVEIGVHDGTRVKYNDERTHKTSLEMTIEDGNGKPSLKLSVNEGIGGETIKKEIKRIQPRKDAFTLLAEIKDNVQIVKIKYDNDGTNEKHSPKEEFKVKKYETTEVQTSEALFRPQKPPCNVNIKRFPQRKFQNPNIYRGHGNLKFANTLDVNEDTNRTPYLVHSLCEPCSRSIQVPVRLRNNSSKGAFYRLDDRHTSGDNIFQKPYDNSILDPSNRNANSKEETRDIDSNKHETPLKRDFGMSTSAVDDFEKVLLNICGPSYYYHSSETSSIDRNEEGMYEENVQSTLDSKKVIDSSCHRSIQTENSHVKTMDEAGISNNYVNLVQRRISLDKTNFDRFYHPDLNIPYRKSRTVHSCTQSNITFKNRMGNSLSETSVKPRKRSPVLEALDNARNEFLNKFKSYQNDAQVQNRTTSSSYNWNRDQNRLNIGDGYKGGIKNHHDFSFEIGAREMDEGFYLNRSEKADNISEKEDTSKGKPVNNSFYHESQMSIISMAVCNGLRRGVSGRKIDCEMVEKIFERNPSKIVRNNSSFRPNKIKSRSCQNIFVSCDVKSKHGLKPGGISKTKKQRYQHRTASEYGFGYDNKKDHSSFELGLEGMEVKGCGGYPLEETNCWRFRDLPPDVGKLLLPRPEIPGYTAASSSEVREGQSASELPLDRLSTMATIDSSSECCPPDSGQLVPSFSRIGRERSNTFQRTILAIKNLFRKKVKNLLGMKSVTESLTRDPKKSTFNRYDKIVFIPVPLEKKNENIHLSRKIS